MILSTSVYISTDTVPTHVVSVRLTTPPSYAEVRDHGGAWSRVPFTRDGDTYTIRHVPLHEEYFYIRFDAGAAVRLDTLVKTDTTDKTQSGDQDDRKQRYEQTGGPGEYDEETGMVNVTSLGGLHVPLPDFNRLRVEYQLRGDLEQVERSRYITEDVYSFYRSLPYEILNPGSVPSASFGSLNHPSIELRSVQSTTVNADPWFVSGESGSDTYNSFGFSWERLRRNHRSSPYRLIARSLAPPPVGGHFMNALMFDEELYNFDYYCDFGG